jgi:hypothetical protein
MLWLSSQAYSVAEQIKGNSGSLLFLEASPLFQGCIKGRCPGVFLAYNYLVTSMSGFLTRRTEVDQNCSSTSGVRPWYHSRHSKYCTCNILRRYCKSTGRIFDYNKYYFGKYNCGLVRQFGFRTNRTSTAESLTLHRGELIDYRFSSGGIPFIAPSRIRASVMPHREM